MIRFPKTTAAFCNLRAKVTKPDRKLWMVTDRKNWRKQRQGKTTYNIFEEHRQMDWHIRSGSNQNCQRQTEVDGHGRRRPQKTWHLEREREVTDSK